MMLVIQCAATKRQNAGHFENREGKVIDFVANPKTAPVDTQRIYARPDDLSPEGKTWRQLLQEYNDEPRNNPLGLLPAYQLYENSVYCQLVEHFGAAKIYILSAGWGLIRATFLVPKYDVSFSINADGYKRRKKADRYADFCMLPKESFEEIVFIGGKDYLPLFCRLTELHHAKRIVFYNSTVVPKVSGCSLTLYKTTTRTNWHYECAKALLDGRIKVA